MGQGRFLIWKWNGVDFDGSSFCRCRKVSHRIVKDVTRQLRLFPVALDSWGMGIGVEVRTEVWVGRVGLKRLFRPHARSWGAWGYV